MRIEYLIDGYNLIRSRPDGQRRPGPGNLSKERHSLLRWIGMRLEENAVATVVFDASSEKARYAPKSNDELFGVVVRFARDYETADDMIKELCREHTHPKQLVVVSNDHQVQKAARRRRAKVLQCDAFMAHLARNARRLQQPQPQPEKPESTSDAEREHFTKVFEPDLPTSNADPNDMSDFYRQMRSLDDPPE